MFFIVWSTQNLSILGSSMTSFALVIWSYQQKGSALTTALLSVCSYAPYVLLSIFAGTLGDRWDKRRTMAVCDSLAGLPTVAVLYDLMRQWVNKRLAAKGLNGNGDPITPASGQGEP